MKRREFLRVLGGAALTCPGELVAQPAQRIFRIGLLFPGSGSELSPLFEELGKLGFIEGQNLAVDRRGTGGGYEQFPAIVTELVTARVDAIACGGEAAIRAAQAATVTIPIIGAADDMVGAGLARSLARPGGNTTGVSILASDLDGKRQEILFELLPGARQMAVLVDSKTTAPSHVQVLRDAARSRGVELSVYGVGRSEDIAPAVEASKTAGAAALNVLASPLLFGNRITIIVRAAALRLPAIYQWPETAREGGLAAYGPRFSEFAQLWARQVGKVLRGAKPADLPIEQPTRFVLAINLKTAKAIGLVPSPAMLNRADEVIE